MVRSIVAVLLLIGATVWTPVWVQILLYCIACIGIRYRWMLCIPALYADALYAPYSVFSLRAHYYLGMVICLLVVWWLVLRFTRLGELYETTLS